MPSLSVRLFIITLLSLLSLLFTPVLLSRDATGVLQIRADFTPSQQQNVNNAPISLQAGITTIGQNQLATPSISALTSTDTLSDTPTPSDCPIDDQEGVYMYSGRDFTGICLFSTTDIPFFGDTIIGNNNLSSIRFIGDWETKIYEDANYTGRYDVVGSDDSNLDIRSLGSNYSSIKITSIIVNPTFTPTPSPTSAPGEIYLLSPDESNGGFETGDLSGWSAEGGEFVIDTESPHSGTHHVKGTRAIQAKLYRRFDLSPYRDAIDEQRVSAYFKTWIDVGKGENYQYALHFLDQNDAKLWTYDTGWQYHPGGYQERGGQLESIPTGTVAIYLEVSVKRSSGSFTDVDLDDFSVVLQIGEPLPPPPPPTPTSTPTGTPTNTPVPITPVPVEPETSYPYVVHMRHFALNVGNYCWGYAPGDPDIVGTYPECASLDRYLSGLKFVAPSGNGYVEAANNLPTTDGGPRWGYAYSFFLNNPGAERTITLPIGGCNDVALYTSTGTVQAERLAENSTTVYHRFPGGPTNSDLIGCPCEHLNPTISIPSGPFRLTAITRGAFCTSYLRIGTPDTSWVPEAGLEIDWNGLYAYVGAQ